MPRSTDVRARFRGALWAHDLPPRDDASTGAEPPARAGARGRHPPPRPHPAPQAAHRLNPREPRAPKPYPAGMLVGRTGLSPVMVGRAAELDRLVGLVGARP